VSGRRRQLCRAVAAAPRLLLLLGLLASCRRPPDGRADAGDAASAEAASFDPLAVARAEDARRAADVPVALRSSRDVVARRRSARALARIADPASVEGLLAHLGDEDHETVAWAAYGLSHACREREEAHIRALSARAASMAPGAEARRATLREGRGAPELDPWTALARAMGRCGGPLAEQALVALLGVRGAWEEPALLGLGDLAARRKQLGAEAMTALLDAVTPRPEGSPEDAAFYALSRAEPGEAFGKRVAEAARAALARRSPARILAVKTLGRGGRADAKEAAAALGRVVTDRAGFDASERAEAARGLGALGPAGAAAAAAGLARLASDRETRAVQGIVGPEHHLLLTLIESLGHAPPKAAEPALYTLASMTAPSAPEPPLERRLAELRCAAALALARGSYDAEVLVRCDAPGSEVAERARLASLLRRTIASDRRAAFRALTRSKHLRVREAAVSAISQHPELGDAAAPILFEALSSKQAGLVAVAAEVLHRHPDRAMILATKEKRAALDPQAPPPTVSPEQELSPAVQKALTAALAEPWPEDRIETRAALVDAAASVRLPQAAKVAAAACSDPSPILRERGLRALRMLGETVAACEASADAPPSAGELDKLLPRPSRVVFVTDAGELAVVLEPELSPVTATRIASLVQAGFYDGIEVHRVVPGFVVQFGDPAGDGYGGSGTLLRCETSPVPFRSLDVGMALFGRDTGSSQLFVTLSRTPHLDGEFTRVGYAEGGWAALAAGDVIRQARIVE
jgi:cyclophilin family peptidyl-prolyl cis-trans isomerase